MRNGSGEDVSGWPRNQESLFSEIKVGATFAAIHINSESGLTCLSNGSAAGWWEVTGTERSRKAHDHWSED